MFLNWNDFNSKGCNVNEKYEINMNIDSSSNITFYMIELSTKRDANLVILK